MRTHYESMRDTAGHAAAWDCVNDQFPVHFHASVEVYQVTEGEIVAIREGGEVLLRAGDMLVNSSCDLHGYRTQAASRSRVATIPPEVAPLLPLSDNRFSSALVTGRAREDAGEILRMMVSACSRADPASDALAAALAAILASGVGFTENPPGSNSFSREVIRFLQDHLVESLDMAALAAHFGYSVGRMSHLFSEKIGCSLPRYVASCRAKLAMERLSMGDSVLDAAMAAGFPNVRALYRAFRSEYGKTPGKFAEEIRLGRVPAGKAP